MQFSKLRLSGFKSFVDPTELQIDAGLTGVVGPNGCGKSNLVEALRWVMGETSAKQMRGGEMDDVIFGGSSDRPARNIAEVQLGIDNSDRRAPVSFNDHDDLTISRRIERGKGSGYRVNGKDSRARDVQLLFADSATGARATGLVSQGRIGAIINAKPRDRRHLLEEAANIRGLHARRHEAELRLRAAETNLERLEDVLTALSNQMEGLRKQARQAARYRSVSDRIRRAESLLFHVRWQAALTVRADAGSRLAACEQIVRQLTADATAVTTAQTTAAATLPSLRQAEAEAAAGLQRITIALADLDAEERRVSTAKSEAETRLRQVADDLEREQTLAAEADVATAKLTAEAATLTAAQADEATSLAAINSQLAETNRAAEAIEDAVAAATEIVATTEAKSAALERQLRQIGDRLAQMDRQSEQLQEQRRNLEAEAVGSGEVDAAAARLAAAVAHVDRAEAARDTAAQSRKMAEESHAELREAERLASIAAGKINAEIDSLSAALDRDQDDVIAPILDHVSVKPGYEKALAAAFGAELDLPQLDPATAANGWRNLPPIGSSAAMPATVTALTELATAPAALQRALSQIGLAADAAEAAGLQAELHIGQCLVTATGGLWRWDGFIRDDVGATPAAVRLQQQNQLLALSRTAKDADQALQTARSQLDAAAQRLRNTEADEVQQRESLRNAYSERDNAQSHQAAIDARLTSIQTKLAALSDTLERIASERLDADEQMRTAQREVADLADVSTLRADTAAKRAELADQRAALLDARTAHDQLTREIDNRQRRLSAIESELAAWRDRLDLAGQRLAELQSRDQAGRQEIAQLAARPGEIRNQRAGLADAQEVAESKRKETADALVSQETEVENLATQSRQAERGLAEARETMVRAEGELESANQALLQLKERIAERLDCPPAEILSQAGIDPDEDFAAESDLAQRVERLLRERDNIGPVNLRAEQEIEELSGQLTTLEQERDDLIAAIAKLRSAITALNREGRQRLVVAFEAVNEHFQKLFSKLFGGGDAHLSLTEEDDPLDAGLEIFASPPGKKMQVMSLLSGGEQALTAIALVFAAFLTNPAPICVLDEVDAPLDDTNVDRFCSLLSEIAKLTGTRFLIITHHRMTMARMDRLFGVTMAERGVSQLVSVDLRGAEQLRDAG